MSPRRLLTQVCRACAPIVILGLATSTFAQSVVDPFIERLPEPELRALAREMLARNPQVAAAAARARAATHRSPQLAALPDPTVGVTAFLESPETRVGPQELMLTASQALPWRAKLTTRAAAADLEAEALAYDVEALRLRLMTELRVDLLELDLLDQLAAINRSIRAHLAQHEHIARARYSTGSGPGQGVVKLQAAITGVDHRLLELEAQRFALVAEINARRDRPATTVLPSGAHPAPAPDTLGMTGLLDIALAARPDLRAARTRVETAAQHERLADMARRPDFRVGLTYTLVDERRDEPGRLQPPPGNGDDILGLQAGVAIPLWRGKIAAGLDEALEIGRQRDQERRVIKARLERDVDDLAGRLPIRWRQLSLLRDVLVLQAQEALDLATSGYVAGSLNALDLLDAEHVLFEAETAVARARTDYLIALTQLEGALATPLTDLASQEAAP